VGLKSHFDFFQPAGSQKDTLIDGYVNSAALFAFRAADISPGQRKIKT